MLLGVKKGQKIAGPAMLAINQLVKIIIPHVRYRYIEMSWTLEDNLAVNQLIQRGGGELHKRYRVYRKGLNPEAGGGGH
jgi:hypothetical protein